METTKKRMSVLGIGPSVGAPSVLYAAAAGVATWIWPEWFAIRGVPYPALLVAGLMLLGLGMVMQAIAGRTLMKAYRQDRLVTTGVYAVCRNPLYANVMFTIAPGIALVCRSWLMLTASVVLYILVRVRVGREEAYLEKRFGQEFLDYRRRTNAIFPTICCCGKEQDSCASRD
jgi:protein-S-isoprenylcysteine O-methyltransferase Ste14